MSRTSGATGAFTCYTFETALAVVAAAERASAPVILLISRSTLAAPGGERLAQALVQLADRADVPALVQLDHVDDLNLIARGLEVGIGSVMVDGGSLPTHQNVELLLEVSSLAARYGAEIEGELGQLAGSEEPGDVRPRGTLTDPGDAKAFVDETGVAVLAVSIGNVHGVYTGDPLLDWQRLAQITAAVEIPLCLHGASGLDAAQVSKAVRLGIGKVNMNTELREAWVAATRRSISTSLTVDVPEIVAAQRAAIEDLVAAKLTMFASRDATAA